jgi:hypothetical protein
MYRLPRRKRVKICEFNVKAGRVSGYSTDIYKPPPTPLLPQSLSHA